MSDHLKVRRKRSLQVMSGVAGVLCLVCLVTSLMGSDDRGQTTERMGQPVFSDFASIRAEAAMFRVTLADEDYALINSGDGWTLEGAGGYPIRADRLSGLVKGLSEMTWDEGRTRDLDKFDRIGLGDPRSGGTGALIEILDGAGDVSASIITGRRGDTVYARRPDEDQAFRVTGDLPPLYNHDAWLDLDVIDINPDTVSAVRLTDVRGRGMYLQRRAGQDARSFRPAPPYQSYRLVSRIAASTPALALTRLQPIGVKPAAELETGGVARHITETFDGLEVSLIAYEEPDGYYVTLRAVEAGEGARRGSTINEKAKGWAFKLAEYDWAEFTPRVSSIARPPAPAPTETTSPSQP